MLKDNSKKNISDLAFDHDQTVQVLALDGGGLKGIYSASVICELEQQLGHSIADHFDIITGTSTGGLIALALAFGKSGEEIKNFYISHGDTIFPSGGIQWLYRSLRWFFSNKYSSEPLRNALEEFFSKDSESKETPILGESQKRLVIPTYLAEGSIPRLLKTPHTSRLRSDWKLPVWAVGMATSAAPTFFPEFDYKGRKYLDGGLWANNPSLVGITEATDLGADLKKIRLLNIGTTFSVSDGISYYLPHKSVPIFKLKRRGLISWAKKLLPTVMEANSDATSKMFSHQLLKKNNFHLINTAVEGGTAQLDNVDMGSLIQLGQSAGEQEFSRIQDYFQHKASQYKPNKETMDNAR